MVRFLGRASWFHIYKLLEHGKSSLFCWPQEDMFPGPQPNLPAGHSSRRHNCTRWKFRFFAAKTMKWKTWKILTPCRFAYAQNLPLSQRLTSCFALARSRNTHLMHIPERFCNIWHWNLHFAGLLAIRTLRCFMLFGSWIWIVPTSWLKGDYVTWYVNTENICN